MVNALSGLSMTYEGNGKVYTNLSMIRQIHKIIIQKIIYNYYVI